MFQLPKNALSEFQKLGFLGTRNSARDHRFIAVIYKNGMCEYQYGHGDDFRMKDPQLFYSEYMVTHLKMWDKQIVNLFFV